MKGTLTSNSQSIKEVILSKSRLMRGLQCEKNLFFTLFKPELEPEPSASTQHQYDEGNEVGRMAQKEFPDGILIETDYWDYELALQKTRKAMDEGALTLFEAAFEFQGCFCRVDILSRDTQAGAWEIIEVKKAGSVKNQYLQDTAIQTWILKNAGVSISKSWLMHINSESVFPELKDFFTKVDVTQKVHEMLPGIESKILGLKAMAKKGEMPAKDIGPHCEDPYPCPFKDQCWGHIPHPSVFDLPGIGQKAFQYYKKGEIKLEDLNPKEFSSKIQRAIKVSLSGKRYVDKDDIKKSISSWKWPLYFLDFETIWPAIALYNGTHPYQQIPFQFSCHVQASPDDVSLKHFEYLHRDISDPRRPLAKAIIDGIGPQGSVVAYNAGFEGRVLRNLAEIFPEYSERLLNIAQRLVDPLPIFRSAVYDKGFLGSFSLKSVAPAIIGESLSYEGLSVGEGGEATVAYLTLIKGDLSNEEKEKIIKALLEYCRQDTLATVELVKWLFKVAQT